ncbi:MAG: hypothetical protein UZ17_ACD001002544 [Acidobacteria bacterium OLB17]|nr:MAG: hypothetical protein UZ17_ACD001002544 [Acidobacteria bacterium OLB17]MCZ2390266.1 hypothetical protein [Acidobacteriota bacterium]
MTRITEAEFARIVDGIVKDRETIIQHNPLGTREEILLWMLLATLFSYLSLSEIETPCFSGSVDAATYREAVGFVLNKRKATDFDHEQYLDRFVNL